MIIASNATYTFYRPQTKFAKVMFLHVSVCPQGGGIPACLAGPQAYTKGEVEGSGGGGLQAHTRGEVGGSGWGVSRPTPGGVSQHALRQTPPPSTQLLLLAVHILLECILVISSFSLMNFIESTKICRILFLQCYSQSHQLLSNRPFPKSRWQ